MEKFLNNYYIERKNTESLKWDKLEERFGQADLLPLWVADMDFKVADEIQSALHQRVDHGVFGYSFLSQDYYQAFFKWMDEKFQVKLKQDHLRFTPGVVQALYHFVNAFTQPEEAVIILTPVYYPFHFAIKDTGRRLVTVDLVENNSRFEIDFERFEQAIIDNQVKLFIHCSPHNPVGRVWTQEEQMKLIEICKKHEVLIISDEIHQDFVFEPNHQIALLSLSDRASYDNIIAVTSASKTFNLAGLTHSILMIPNQSLRDQYDQYIKQIGQSEINLMGAIATQAGYQFGDTWLKELKSVITHNYERLKNILLKFNKEIVVYDLEGTYLLFINLTNVLKDKSTKEVVQDQAQLAIDFGEWFGEGYENYIRINLATHPKLIEQAAEQLVKALEQLN